MYSLLWGSETQMTCLLCLLKIGLLMFGEPDLAENSGYLHFSVSGADQFSASGLKQTVGGFPCGIFANDGRNYVNGILS